MCKTKFRYRVEVIFSFNEEYLDVYKDVSNAKMRNVFKVFKYRGVDTLSLTEKLKEDQLNKADLFLKQTIIGLPRLLCGGWTKLRKP